MNACEVYQKCKSKELITLFNQSGLCISYHSMKRHRTDLAKYVIKQTNDTEITVPLESHFSASSFTLSAFDNFDHNDNSSLSGKKSTHDTTITLFQVKPSTPVNKPLKSEVNCNLSSINSFFATSVPNYIERQPTKALDFTKIIFCRRTNLRMPTRN